MSKKPKKDPIWDRKWNSLSSLVTHLNNSGEKVKHFDGVEVITRKGRYTLSPDGLHFDKTIKKPREFNSDLFSGVRKNEGTVSK